MKAFEEISKVISEKLQEVSQEAEILLREGRFLEASERLRMLEQEISDLCWESLLQEVFSDANFLQKLRELGARKGMRLVSYQPIEIILPSGNRIEIKSPFFVKASPKKGRKKKGPQGRGHHLGLEWFGFVHKVAPNLAFEAVQMSLLCPSFDVASRVLKQRGISLSKNKLRKLSATLGCLENTLRVELTLEEGETLKGKRVLIVVDGGRLRSRKNKRGPIPQGKKGRGFHTDWIEPKLFAIYVLDDQGHPLKGVSPHVDGSTGDWQEMNGLLKAYLQRLEIDEAQEVILAGDGAPWIWERIPPLLETLGIPKEKLTEILDWTHAKQNLLALFDGLSQKALKALAGMSLPHIKDLLFHGKMNELFEQVKRLPNQGAAKKFQSYFLDNQQRMKYAEFRDRRLPIGSGFIESAIRRVINLRLKSTGSFWLLENAEALLFLRAQSLYGRWEIFQKHWCQQLTQAWNSSADHSHKMMAFPQKIQRENTKTHFVAENLQYSKQTRKQAA